MGTILRAVVVYWVLLLVLRLMARRPAAHLTPFELILMFLLGGTAIQGIVGDDPSLTNVLSAIATVTLMHMLVAAMKQKWPWFAQLADGTPVVVYADGAWDRPMMNQLRIQDSDVLSAAREKGLDKMQDVRFATVERNGTISIIPLKK